MITCTFCERLYSEHSITIHSKKCRNNPNAIADSSITKINKKPLFNSNRKKTQERPRTRSLCRHAEVTHRICFICGNQFDYNSFEEHENNCVKEWSLLAAKVPSKFELFQPVPLLIPSLDGSLDIVRLNEHAHSQSKKAQNPRCGATIQIQDCSQHKCLKREPLIEYFF